VIKSNNTIFLKLLFTLIVVLAALAPGAAWSQAVLISGRTMSTTYHIKVVAGAGETLGPLRQEIEACLNGISNSMSTFIPGSEITRFNNLQVLGQHFEISPDFSEVLKTAARLHRLTGGAWDGTVGPLVDLWGFGSQARAAGIPDGGKIKEKLALVDFGAIDFCGRNCIAKSHAGLSLDLASIAKGYGVDSVARLIARAGWSDYLVEIGGEIYAAGKRPDGTPWRVGINRPLPGAAPTDVYQVVTLSGKALATSGDYRSFFEVDGVRYSHIIDPRTGYPVRNGVVSATVLAADCTLADGLATALMVMGPEGGVPLVNTMPGVECLIVVRGGDGVLVNHPSRGFGAYSLDPGE